MSKPLKWSMVERPLELLFAFVTASASVVLACTALLALQEAKREWLMVPAPENLRGELLDGSVRLSWEMPQKHADFVRELVVLKWSNQDGKQYGVRHRVTSLPSNVRFYSAPACKYSRNAAQHICVFRVQAIGWNKREGKLSRAIVCTSMKCGYVPGEEEQTVWQEDY